VSISTGQLSHFNFLFFSSFFEDKIWKSVNFCYVSDMANLSYSELASKVAAKSVDFEW
jgi:hypothetical protein